MNLLPFELINTISSFQDNISDVSNLRCVSKRFQKLPLTPRINDNSVQILYNLGHVIDVEVNTDITWEFVKYNKDKEWNYQLLSKNSNITWEHIFEDEKQDWNYRYCMIYKPITMKQIIDHPEIDWNYKSLSSNSGITFEDVINNPQYNWNITDLSSNPNIDIDTVNNNPNLNWNWYSLTRNIARNWKIVKNNLDKPWDWDYLICEEFITYQRINKYSLPVDLSNYVYNKRHKDGRELLKIINENPNTFWDYNELSCIMNEDIIRSNIGLPWNYKHMSSNPNISWKFIDEFSQPWIRWDKCKLSSRSDITLDILIEKGENYWSMKELSSNPVIRIDILYILSDWGWDTNGLSQNPNIDWSFVLFTISSWNWVWDKSVLGRNIC